jgi:hypothetical protein
LKTSKNDMADAPTYAAISFDAVNNTAWSAWTVLAATGEPQHGQAGDETPGRNAAGGVAFEDVSLGVFAARE